MEPICRQSISNGGGAVFDIILFYYLTGVVLFLTTSNRGVCVGHNVVADRDEPGVRADDNHQAKRNSN